MKEILPSIDNISDYYGKSLFSCPYCDGWELKDRPLVVIVDEQKQSFHFTQTCGLFRSPVLMTIPKGELGEIWTSVKKIATIIVIDIVLKNTKRNNAYVFSVSGFLRKYDGSSIGCRC